MDAFKHAEIQRMELGGNEPWKTFYDGHAVTISEGRTFEDSTIKERYEGDAGEEWKERLSCKVEGREYVPGQEKKNNNNNNAPASRSGTPMSLSGGVTGGARTGSPAASSIRSHDSQRGGAPTKNEQNETYFAKLGNENATRSDALPPSQGGKFTGFGGGMPPSAAAERRSSPFGGFGGWGGGPGGASGAGLEDLQKDPLGTLTKGLGWFASTVGKSAKQVNESYLQPTAKQVSKPRYDCIRAELQA
jgi:ADP-ribosylation factor GTPase-activating protein 1